jgi:FAD-dependent oxidoreductase family protein
VSNAVRTGGTTIACDVLIVGGGAAGVAAATAAGRAGARVVLLERYGFLGGLATTAQVGTICGLYLRDATHAEATPVGGGFAQEFAARLQQATDVKPIRVMDTGLWVLPYPPPAFARVADAMVVESKNVTVILHATVAEAQAEGPRLNQIRALAWNEPLLFRPTTVVDCTGEATAASLGGANAENGGADQAPALVFVLEHVDPGLAQRGLLEVRRELHRAVESGALPTLCERLSLVPGSGANGRLAFKLSLMPASPDRALWQQVTDWEREARALLEPLRRFLVENIPSCRNARLDSVAPQLGVRSGRRILGRARLTDQDVLDTRKIPSGIARGCWPMERWTSSPRPEMTYFAERDFYDIPLDCLRPAELDNVWVAGRCFSATTGAMTSARVIGTALATGWAAGTAAAFQASGQSLEDAVTNIRRSLHQ